jgi:hypothetical protein
MALRSDRPAGNPDEGREMSLSKVFRLRHETFDEPLSRHYSRVPSPRLVTIQT